MKFGNFLITPLFTEYTRWLVQPFTVCFGRGISKMNLLRFATFTNNPAGIYLLKVNGRNTRTRCEICSKLTIKTLKRQQWTRSGVFTVNFEHISHLALVFLLLTWRRFGVFIVNFEHISNISNLRVFSLAMINIK